MTREQQIVKLVDDYKASDPVANQLLNRNAAFGLVRHVLEWADSHPAWVSVEERMPEENEEVLAYNAENEEVIACDYHHKMFHCWPEAFNESVTHWMPLPTKPVKKGDEE